MTHSEPDSTGDAVRPPARERPSRVGDDPLADWDRPGDTVGPAGPPPEWAVVAGTAVASAVIAAAGGSGRPSRLVAGVRGLLAGAVVAVVALQPWRRDPEDDAWAREVAAGRQRPNRQP